ncbi:phosphate acetyltransferase [Martelella radicis]|uniref:Phosphate acetyltransferase n=1 Tax=Martelella radicis TaxID=1397476 RepID=A0A7W6KND3_9HYPH|nr:phosphate acetyltransferase [Martelella radicis]MBB4124397.1 phosphate acetyltransferase [Martelella radicis]
MKPLEKIMAAAKRLNKKIVLPEADDPRILEAACKAAGMGLARIVLVGNRETISARCAQLGLSLPEAIETEDPQNSPLLSELVALYFRLRKHKGITEEDAARIAREPHVFAALMVKADHADGTVGGAHHSTADMVRTAIQVIGPAPGTRLVSSFFLMLMEADHHPKKGAFIFCDPALVVDPNPGELSKIAIAAAHSFDVLTGETPKIAMLSFATRGSASHPSVDKVEAAVKLLKLNRPDLLVDGPMQFDAAFVPEIAAAKGAGEPLGGEANIFIFPNLEAGNIGYKIAERIGGATAVGPVLQGLAKPANDLSRGCSAEDVLDMIAVTACQVDAHL